MCLCQISLYSSDPCPFTYCINGSPVKSVSHYVILECIFSNYGPITNLVSYPKVITLFFFLGGQCLPIIAQYQTYISLVQSNLAYCFKAWRPHPLKDIRLIERVRHHSTKFILSDYASDCKSRSINTNLLLLSL